MPNATYRDCRAGFDVFRRHGGEISREDLNAELVETGYGMVSDRTFVHYGKLLRSGFDRYISINRFDVSRAAVPFEDSSANPRYGFDPSDQGVRLLIAKGSQLYEVAGRADQLGEIGAIVRVSEPEFIDGLRRIRVAPGNMVSLRFLESGRTIEGHVVEADLESGPALLEIEYVRVTSLFEIGVRSPIPMVGSRVVLRTSDESPISLDLASRRLFHFFDLVEELRSILNDLIKAHSGQNYVEPPVLVRLRVASPAVLEILSAPELIDFLKVVGGAVVLAATTRKLVHESTGAKLDNKLKRFAIRKAEREEEELDSRAELRRAVVDFMSVRSIDADPDELTKAIEDHVLPSRSRLSQQGVIQIDVRSSPKTLPLTDPADEPPKAVRKAKSRPRKG